MTSRSHCRRSPTLPPRLILGTAQFDGRYGISRQSGPVSLRDLRNILTYAWSTGIRTLDTAMAYGNVESMLGNVGVKKWRVITKIPLVPDEIENVDVWTQKLVEESLTRLKIDSLAGVLVHYPHQLSGDLGRHIFHALAQLKSRTLVETIGVSIYCPSELPDILDSGDIDVVQAPMNILDQRLRDSGWLSRLPTLGITLDVRSVFLQGLLLMDATNRPIEFNNWNQIWTEWHSWLERESITAIDACLGYILSQDNVSRLVIGVESMEQLEDLIQNSNPSSIKLPQGLSSNDLNLIDPRRWLSS